MPSGGGCGLTFILRPDLRLGMELLSQPGAVINKAAEILDRPQPHAK